MDPYYLRQVDPYYLRQVDPYYLRHDGIELPPSTPMFAMPSNIGEHQPLSKERYDHLYADLKKAIERGEFETAEDLLKDNSFSCCQNTFSGNKLLDGRHSYNDGTSFLLAIDMGRTDFVKLLVNYGASVNDTMGMSPYRTLPLHRACAGGHLEVVRYLLRAGADINRKNLEFNTPLHMAVGRFRAEVVSLLLSSGATFDQYLLDRINPYVKDNAKDVWRTVLTLLQHGVAINSEFMTYKRALHWALRCNDMDAVRLFIECGARPNPRDFPQDGIGEVKQDPDVYEWLLAATKGPSSLKCLCATVVRTHLVEKRKRHISEDVDKLPLPTPLIKYLSTLDRFLQWKW